MADNKKIKILLVDDDEIHLTTAELFLKGEYEIHKAQSGQEALECITSNKFIPNLILLDVIMPNKTGWEVFKKIREMRSLKDVPIIFITSMAEEEERKKAYKMGIADYIIKPFNMTELKSRIKAITRNFKIQN
jgi:putative two-component system response regulator